MFLSDSIDKFKITKHRDGKYPAIITISGWRTQDKDNRKDWEESILKAFTDKSFFEEIKKELASDLKLSEQARNNPIENLNLVLMIYSWINLSEEWNKIKTFFLR